MYHRSTTKTGSHLSYLGSNSKVFIIVRINLFVIDNTYIDALVSIYILVYIYMYSIYIYIFAYIHHIHTYINAYK